MSETVIDPVCGMRFETRHAASAVEVEGRIYCFCSPFCAREFQANPSQFTARNSEEVRQ